MPRPSGLKTMVFPLRGTGRRVLERRRCVNGDLGMGRHRGRRSRARAAGRRDRGTEEAPTGPPAGALRAGVRPQRVLGGPTGCRAAPDRRREAARGARHPAADAGCARPLPRRVAAGRGSFCQRSRGRRTQRRARRASRTGGSRLSDRRRAGAPRGPRRRRPSGGRRALPPRSRDAAGEERRPGHREPAEGYDRLPRGLRRAGRRRAADDASLSGFAFLEQLAVSRELLEGALLELSYALARDAELLPGLLQRDGFLPGEAEAELEHTTLHGGEGLEGVRQRAVAERDLNLLGQILAGRRDEVAERGGLVLADRTIEACERPNRLACLSELVERDLGRLRDLILGRQALELRGELALRPRGLALEIGDVDRHADDAGAILDTALHRLADPPRRVGRELEAAAPVELLDRSDEAEHTFLDQVEQCQAVSLVALRDRDDEPQVRVDHLLLGGEVAALDSLGELDLVLCGQQRIAADLVQEQLEAVGGRDREAAVRVLALARIVLLCDSDLGRDLLDARDLPDARDEAVGVVDGCD